MINYDWEEILSLMKAFARVDDITDIILLGEQSGEGQGIRRISLKEIKDGGMK